MNKTIQKIRRRLVLLFLMFLPPLWISSCDYSYWDEMENIQDYTYDPVFAIPLVDASISIDDLFEIGELDQINVDEENLITLVYKGEVFSLSASDLFHINDQVQDVSFTGIDPVAGGSVTLDPKVFLISFDNSEILSYISFLEGNFAVTIQADE
ncbi:MAG: hypothetical protein ACOCX0_07080, partial [Bacteroidota bacterium]